MIDNYMIATKAEEIANALTHGLGIIFGIFALHFLNIYSYGCRIDEIIALKIYGLSFIGVYASSTIYHILEESKLKNIWRIIDHIFIYLFIAGTYTPILVKLQDFSLLLIIWSIVILGIGHKIWSKNRFSTMASVIYLILGWMCLLIGRPIIDGLTLSTLMLLIAGGVCYTIGFIFYLKDYVPYFHTIWHIFVLLGSLIHYIAILRIF